MFRRIWKIILKDVLTSLACLAGECGWMALLTNFGVLILYFQRNTTSKCIWKTVSNWCLVDN